MPKPASPKPVALPSKAFEHVPAHVQDKLPNKVVPVNLVDVTAGGNFVATAARDYFIVDYENLGQDYGSLQGFDPKRDKIVVENFPNDPSIDNQGKHSFEGHIATWLQVSASDNNYEEDHGLVVISSEYAPHFGWNETIVVIIEVYNEENSSTVLGFSIEYVDAVDFYENNLIVTTGDWILS